VFGCITRRINASSGENVAVDAIDTFNIRDGDRENVADGGTVILFIRVCACVCVYSAVLLRGNLLTQTPAPECYCLRKNTHKSKKKSLATVRQSCRPR